MTDNVVHLKGLGYIEVEQCDLDLEQELREAYAVNGPVCTIIAEFREEVARSASLGRQASAPAATQGCVCPPGAENTCRGPLCPRRPIGAATASGTLTEGGDVEQAPGDSLSGPTGNAGDAQGPSA